MEIISSSGEPVLISDYEVKCLLEERKELHSTATFLCQDALTVEFETLSYLSDVSPVSEIKNAQAFEQLMTYLGTLRLTKFERLQVINSLPRNVIDFYVLVEECEERFETQQIEEILQMLSKLLNPHSEA